jgi:hypothetical protein
MADLQVADAREIARPLKVLEPLIRSDFEAAERVGMPYYRAAGEKLVEARDGPFAGNVSQFYQWARRRFGRSKTQIRLYTKLVTHVPKRAAAPPQSLDEFRRELGHKAQATTGRLRRAWQADVQKNIDAARARQARLAEEELTRQQERKAERDLALKLIDIGYKVLARELHPDKGGSRDAMARLNRVRKHLQHFA